MRFASGVTDQFLYFVALDDTTGALKTGLSSFTVYRSRDGAAAAAFTTPTINETDATNMPGVYELLLDEDMTIGSGNDSEEMAFRITATGMLPVTRTIELYRSKITQGNTLDVTATGAAGIDWGNVENPTTALNLSATNIDVDQVVASVSGAVGSVTGAVGSVTGNVGGNVVGSVASVTAGVTLAASAVQAIWDALTAALTTVGSIGKLLVDNINGTITSRASQTSVDDLPTNAELTTALGTADDAVLTQVALVKAKTDLIPASPAATGDIPTAAAIADAVWDEDATAHQTQGTFGQAIGDPAADADSIWALVNTNLDAAVSSRLAGASYTAPDNATITAIAGYVDTEIGTLQTTATAIKAKTDSLTFTVAGQVDANVKSVAGGTITGTGSEADPWGP